MKLAIASDHRGYELKKYLLKNLKGYEIEDLGTDSNKSVDYPDYGFKLGEYVVKNNCFGIAICGSGIGISIACNKVKGVRCAKVNFIKEAIITRKDNNSNVVAISSDINRDRALRIIESFIETEFSKEERHIKRINKIKEYEKK
ncbi:MAG: RpiB/LacA/LacB family sugar-phosphate isomerase [Bacilli bacterium]|nr:RpiB/LacA/LacB family sugar-phosphate isomerase [Bacilli bacterium]